MRIAILLPTVLASQKYAKDRIFAPKDVAVNLADGLVEKGHEVFLYTAEDVITKAKIISGDMNLINNNPSCYTFRFREKAMQEYTTTEIIKRDFELQLTTKAYQDALNKKVDIIHSFFEFSAHYFDELTHFPTVYTLHDPLPQEINTIEYLRFSKFSHHNYISISNSQRNGIVKLNFVKTIYHGVNLNEYNFNDKPENHLIYFGRVLEDKGVDLAIQAAKELNIPLQIATSNAQANKSAAYFEEKIIPSVDGKQVILKGYVLRKDKSDFINNGLAFVFPLRWDEPFGLTVIEAMACGTPVITFNHGSMLELVKDKETGYVVDYNKGVEGIKEAIRSIGKISRKKCREHVERNFTIEKMVNNHLEVYQNIIDAKKI